MRYLYVLVGLAVVLSAALAAAGSFKTEMAASTYVDASNKNMSFGENDTTLWVSSSNGKPEKETYLSFRNNFGSAAVFKSDKISSATLKLYATKVETPGEIKAYFVHGPTFDTATWVDKPEYDSSVSASIDVQKEGEYSMDVTPLLKKAVDTCADGCDYSIVLISVDKASVGFSKNASEKPSLEYATGS